ncbi:putative helicase mov-10-B.1 [Epargyreus clarus]|uniref:putative helicase mov-10-B.1 n=1 Tax=Epargyreus clarus TaxID=520877 RepID=UPI003C2BBAD7
MELFCEVCGMVDEYYDENALIDHKASPKHICNLILLNYNNNKRTFSKNRDGVQIFCTAQGEKIKNTPGMKVEKSDQQKIRLIMKPGQKAKFSFSITNDMKNEDLMIIGIQLAHPQPLYQMDKHPFVFGEDPNILKKKSSVEQKILVKFVGADIGQYEMPIMFTFHRPSDKKDIIVVREMVVLVQENPIDYIKTSNPYTGEDWAHTDKIMYSTGHIPFEHTFKIPKLLKTLLPRGLEDKALEGLQLPQETIEQLRKVLIATRAIFDEGPTPNNYRFYFHHLLWWEEIVARINLRKYNMFGVYLQKKGDVYLLEVPGLAEKRPSLIRGDRVYLRSVEKQDTLFESTIKHIEDNYVQCGNLDESFDALYRPDALFDVRFLMSRVPVERMHDAVSRLEAARHTCRVFPEPARKTPQLIALKRFYNPLIAYNEEQRSAVEHIVAGTSGRAPYIVFGPPGTGKTMTIVEAIIQLVVRNPKNRVMVCTDSNMAADHIALILLQYNKMLNYSNFLLRANSQSREWSVMPPALASVSNGTSYESYYPVNNEHAAMYRVFVTTLLHAAKYGTARSQSAHKLQMSHLFIDEAAQASEPAALVPLVALLAPAGRLVLAGDPMQLGPVCISREAKLRGLGVSLMTRLIRNYENLYTDNPNYITMLVKNFRSDPDILTIPNELFYDNALQALAPPDALSKTSILGLPGGDRAIVFHAVESREQKIGNAPSFFNEKELDMLKRYTRALIEKHQVAAKDIGIIAPYIRQVYKMKSWLQSVNFEAVEVGTVEAFQGKEKRVILVSTVRANCKLLDHDAKYNLGFLVDDKRYNVTLTRAKAKIVIIGNASCLSRDAKWRKYMEMCKEMNCYHGEEGQQVPRTSFLLTDIARTRFDKCRLSDQLKKADKKKNKEKIK